MENSENEKGGGIRFIIVFTIVIVALLIGLKFLMN